MRSIERSPGKPGDFCARRAPGQVFDWTRGPGTSVILAETCQLVLFDPTLLSCAKRRGVEPPRRNCYFTLARKYTRVCGPLCDPRGAIFILPHRSSVFYGFCQHSLSGLQLQTGLQLVQRSDCRAANLQSFAAARHFCSAKILAGGLPAQRNFQRKFALRQVGSARFVVPRLAITQKYVGTLDKNNPNTGQPRGARGTAVPFVSGGVQRNPFQGVPLGNFFAEARHRASFRR